MQPQDFLRILQVGGLLPHHLHDVVSLAQSAGAIGTGRHHAVYHEWQCDVKHARGIEHGADERLVHEDLQGIGAAEDRGATHLPAGKV